MTPTFKVAILLCALVALLGISISLYTEFIAGIKPCFSCNLLRYSYFLILVISLLSLKFRSLTPVLLVISAFIIVISAWGFMGYIGYVSNPCIEACPLGEDLEVGFKLFTLAMVGGVVEAILSYMAIKRSS